jgi:hypothetical protein
MKTPPSQGLENLPLPWFASDKMERAIRLDRLMSFYIETCADSVYVQAYVEPSRQKMTLMLSEERYGEFLHQLALVCGSQGVKCPSTVKMTSKPHVRKKQKGGRQ